MKNFDIVGHRKWWFCLSGLLVLIALICIIVKGFNFGIDFTGGTILDLKFAQPVTVAQVRTGLEQDGLQSSVIQLSGDTHEESGKEVIIRTRSLSSEEAQTITSHISAKVGKAEINRVETVGAVIGSEVTKNTVLNVGLSFAILIIYMSIRFEHRIAFSAIAAIVHDIIVVLGVFALFHLEIDASFLAAILTVLGYSMNESVVIFDRVRENTHTHKRSDTFADLANASITQSIHRSFYTLATVMFACVSLYLFGGDTTKNFALCMIIGFASGAYSSICVATSLWVMWKSRNKNDIRNQQ